MQSHASSLGFDWPDISGVLAKAREEVGEIEEAVQAGDIEHAGRELGDLLMAAVNIGRFLHIRPEKALEGANARFTDRFSRLCAEFERRGVEMKSCSLEELDAVWEHVKVVAAQPPNEGG